MGVKTINLVAMKTLKVNYGIKLENEEALDQEDDYKTSRGSYQ